jgi:hypothetical protein
MKVKTCSYLSDFLLVKIFHFPIKKCPKQHGQGKILENFQKTCHNSRKKVTKLPGFLEDLGRFLLFFF